MNKTEVETGHREFVAAHLALIERAAIIGYQRIGRGLVIVDHLDDCEVWGAWYVPTGVDELAVLRRFGLESSSLEYDPAKQLVVLFVEGPSRYVYRCRLSASATSYNAGTPRK